MPFVCKCTYSTSRGSSMKNHFNKQDKCMELDQITKNDILHICNLCSKKYNKTKIEHDKECHIKEMSYKQIKDMKIHIKELTENNINITKELTENKNNNNIKNITELKENINIKNVIENITEIIDIGYIYLIQLYPYEKCIYKLGQTENFERRLPQYKSHKPIVIFYNRCMNYNIHESSLLKLFCDKFNKLTDRGNEYFNGDVNNMLDIIYEYFFNLSRNIKNE